MPSLPQLIFDVHLDLSYNALDFNRDQRWTQERIRRRELGMTDFNLKIEKICEHIDHICQLAGNTKHVGIGSDLDGGYGTEQTPLDLDSIADLAKLDGLLAARGFKPADIDGIFHGNFVNFLRKVWK